MNYALVDATGKVIAIENFNEEPDNEWVSLDGLDILPEIGWYYFQGTYYENLEKKYAVVVDGIVKNVVTGFYPMLSSWVEITDEAVPIGPDWLYDDTNFIPPNYAEISEKISREWRNSELIETDKYASLDDHPEKELYEAYRQLLRDWPATESFPNTRPTLDDAREVPQKLTQLAFIKLMISAGGAEPSDVMQAKQDADLSFFWLVFELADEVDRDYPELQQFLDAAVQKGYIVDKQPIIDEWPTLG